MQIVIGSKNQAKIDAVEIFFRPEYEAAVFISVPASSGVASQPLSLNETVLGARNRAQSAWEHIPDSGIAIGLEGGLTPVEWTQTGYMNICAAILYDGAELYTGLSSGFEHPARAVQLVLESGLEIRDAYVQAGLETDPSFSTGGGAVGFMTDGAITRSEYCRQALQMAFAAYRKRDYLRT